MNAERCDSCFKISPDDDGLFIANKWVEVIVYHRQKTPPQRKRSYVFCEECLPYYIAEKGPSLLSKLKEIIKRYRQ